MSGPGDVLREQTIPALRGSGGDGHADAIEDVLSSLAEADRLVIELERLRDEVARLANLNISIGDDAAKARAELERQLAEARGTASSRDRAWVAERAAREAAEAERDGYRTRMVEYHQAWQAERAAREAAEAESASVSRTCGHLSDIVNCWIDRGEAAEAEVRRVNENALDQIRDECHARALAEARVDRLRTRVEGLLHRMTSEEAAGEIERLRAEVARLEGLILDWKAYYDAPSNEEAEPLRGAVYDMEMEAKSIRAREGRNDGTHRCHACGKQTRDTTAGCDHCDLEDK